MNVVVLVARRADGGQRDRLWNFARQRWEQFGPIIEGHHNAGAFNRAAALNDAARQAGAWDVAVVVDADVLANPIAVANAVEVAQTTGRMVVSHNERIMLNKAGTDKVLAGFDGSWRQRQMVETIFTDSVSCCVTIPRALWDLVGGFDERFEGWGYEDTAFEVAAETLSGKPLIRLASELFHLWHATSPEAAKTSSTRLANQARRDRYLAARGDVDAVRALLAEVDLSPSRIPRIFHRTVPVKTGDEVESYWTQLQKLHPGWEFRTYRDPLDPKEWPLTGDLFKRCQNGAQLAGLVRLESLVTHGGVYVDSDVQPCRTFEPLVHVPAFAGWEDETTLPDAVLGAEPNHPAFVLALEKARHVIEGGGDAWLSGPGVTTEVLPNRSDVLCLPPGAFYPHHYLQKHKSAENDGPWIFCRHMWHHSWGTPAGRASIEKRQRVEPPDSLESMAVVIPYREGDEHRERALEWVTARYRDAFPGVDIILGSCNPDLPFNRAEAMLDGARQTDADVFIVSDGDVWCDGLPQAVENVHRSGWAIPHRLLCRLSEPATARVVAGEPLEAQKDFAEKPYPGFEAGTLFVIKRDVLLGDGMPDTRCVGWGHEEQIHALILNALVGKPWRGQAKCFHLFHEPQERRSRGLGSEENAALLKRYTAARHDPVRIRALIDEAKAVTV